MTVLVKRLTATAIAVRLTACRPSVKALLPTVRGHPAPVTRPQHRIVAKVDELMALCDRLEAQLTPTEADSRRLLEAVLHEALAPALEETA